MAGRLIGEAYISLLPDPSLFRTRASSEINAALAGLRPSVKITADAGDVAAKISAIAAALKGLNKTANIDLGTKGALVDISTLSAALEALKARAGNIPLDFNDSKSIAKMFTLMASIEDLEARASDMDADFNINRALAKFYTLEGGVKSLEDAAQSMSANFNIDEATAQLAKLRVYVAKLADQLDNMRADVSDAGALAKIVSMQAAALKLAKTLEDMPVTADTLPFQADMFKLAAQVEAFKKTLSMPVTATTLPKTPGAYETLNVSGLSPGESQMMDELAVKTLDAMTAFKSLNQVMDDNTGITARVVAGLAKVAAIDSMIITSNSGGWWGALTTKISLFGHALDSVLPKLLTEVSVWHIAADMILEFAAAWGPALIAVGTFAAYAYPVGEKIYGQWKNINTILDGVGGKLPDLGTSFDTIERAIEPSVLEAFGEYMAVIGKNAVPLGDALAKVGQVVDVWGAKMVGWADSAQKSFDNIVSVGAKDFAQLGYAFEQAFRIIGSLIGDLPGFVHIFLTMGDAILTVAANAVAALGPLLKITLWAHGVILYVGLATSAIVALGRAMAAGALASFAARTGAELTAAGTAAEESSGKFTSFGLALGSMAGNIAGVTVKAAGYSKAVFALGASEGVGKAGALVLGDAMDAIPFGPVGLAAAAAAVVIGGILYFALKHSQDAAEKFSASISQLISSSDVENIGTNLATAFAETSKNIAATQIQLSKLIATGKGAGVMNFLNQQQISAATTNLKQYEQQQIVNANTAATYGSRLSQLSKVFGSVAGAQAALTLAGISAGKVAKETDSEWATQYVELQALARGYGYMGQQAGAAGGQLNALNIASGTTYKNIQALTQAEQGWITLITGGESAFTTFEQGFSNISTAMGKTAASAPTVSVSIGKLRQTFTALGGTMTGTSASSLAVRQAFDSQLSAAATLWGNLQTLAGASGNTAKAQSQLAKAGKDVIAQLLPFAAGSKQATSEVSALAQLMGGPATDSFQVLAKWVGNTKGAEADLNKQQADLTISSANLTTAAKNLGNALNTSLNSAEVAAAVKTGTLGDAINRLAQTAAASKGAVTQASVSFSGEYVSALEKAGVGTNAAVQDLNAYLKLLGYSPAAIKTIDSQLGDSVGSWNKYNKAVMQNNASAKVFQADAARNKDALAALNGLLPMTTAQFNILWGAINKQDQALATTGKDATVAKTQFVNFATQGLDVTASKAQALWARFGQQNLDTLAAKAGATKQQFIQFAENGLHLTTTQAQGLWSEFALQNLDTLASKGTNAKNKFIDLAKNGLDLTTSEANTLWTTLTHQYLDTVAHKAGETEQAFIGTAHQFGLTTTAAEQLWQQLKNIPANVHTNYSLTLSGSGEIKAAITAQSLTLTSAGLAAAAIPVGVAAPKKAAGGLLGGPGPSGHDSSLFWGAPGELVIPSTHAPAHMVQAKREGIPGMAAGGVVGSVSATLANVQQGATTTQQAMSTFANEAAKSWLGQLNTAWATAGGAYNGPASFGGGFESLAALVAFAKYFMQNGLNAAAAAGMAATISGEEDAAGPESRNCVPLSYKVVTRRGILAHDEVKTGDEVPAYDLTTRTEVWATVLDIPYHYDAEMCRIGNSHWTVTCTVDHKWITERGLIRADRLRIGEMVKLGNGRAEPMYSFERLPNEDTFCLTTTTGTWTTVKDDGDEIWTGNSAGFGLIGWTGNTVGLPPGYTGPTGNVAYDLAEQLKGVIGYMNARGGAGPLNAAGSPVAAGDVWSRYEAPLVPLSDTRPAIANEIYAQLTSTSAAQATKAIQTQKQVAGKINQVKPHAGGGVINEPVLGYGLNSGTPYSFAENGQPEFVSNASQATAAGNPGIQGATNIGQQTLINQQNMMIKLLQQLPYALANGLATGTGNGVKHGYYGAQN